MSVIIWMVYVVLFLCTSVVSILAVLEKRTREAAVEDVDMEDKVDGAGNTEVSSAPVHTDEAKTTQTDTSGTQKHEETKPSEEIKPSVSDNGTHEKEKYTKTNESERWI